jgi:hypothetical protein
MKSVFLHETFTGGSILCTSQWPGEVREPVLPTSFFATMNNLLLQLTLGDSVHPAKIYGRVSTCVTIIRRDLSLFSTFEFSCFPVDFISRFLGKNDRFVITTVNVE